VKRAAHIQRRKQQTASLIIRKKEKQPISCNACGKMIVIENGIMKEDAFEATKEWGYFSKRDMEVHRFNLCEECYERITAQFKIPVQVDKKVEAL
jgi:Fe2+ or Zn2+ uptake regulation protein